MGEVDDFALADSFINFDYVPDIPNPENGSDPNAVGSRSSHPGRAGNCSIEEGIEKMSLVGIEGKGRNGDEIIANDESESSESESSITTSSSSASSEITSSSAGDETREVEEGEIVDSDDDDDDNEEDSEEMASWGIVNHDDDDDVSDDGGAGDNRATGKPIRSKNEREILPPVPPVNVTLGSHHQMLPVGVVMSILGTQVIVERVKKHDPLNEGSILWMTESRRPLGLIDEIFGPVKNPYYIVRYNSENEVPEGIRGGTLISFVPEFANHVLNNKDLYKKGYDASGLHDEEVSDEAEFSDDEKEAEYKRMHTMTKRGINNQNLGMRKNNRKKVLSKDGSVPTFPVAPSTPLLDHGRRAPIPGIGQGHFGATNINPPFSPANASPNLTTSGVWTNGATLPPQQSAVLPNGFPTNGISWYPENTQISHQLPVPGIPFQQQLNPIHGCPPATMFPGVWPNIFVQPMYAQGLVNQSQTTFGLSSPFPQTQPPVNLHFGSISGNQHAPHQFNPGTSANRGRKTFHQGSRKGWRPAK